MIERFKNIYTATHPGIIEDIWTNFQFYCYDATKVAKYLNKIMGGKADEEDQTEDGSEMDRPEQVEDS